MVIIYIAHCCIGTGGDGLLTQNGDKVTLVERSRPNNDIIPPFIKHYSHIVHTNVER